MPWCVVQKRFGGPRGALFLIGQLLELPDGTRLHQLIEQRFVRLATQKEVDGAEEVDVDVDPPTPTETPKVRRRKHGKKLRAA
jgi:hypothetical protein